MILRTLTDEGLAQNAYLIGCQRTGEALVIDPERDVDRYLALAESLGLKLTAVAETHLHADYLSGARELVERHGLRAYLSVEGGEAWQFEWAKGNPRVTGLRDGDEFRIGGIRLQALGSPGHTPEHLSFVATDEGGGADEPMLLFSGDFLFVGDAGRPDLLESAAGVQGVMELSARQLYRSLRKLKEWPEHLQVLPAHGAGSACGKSLGAVPSSVLGYELKFNGALRLAIGEGEDEFVKSILAGQPEPPPYFARMKRDNRGGPELLPEGRLPAPERVNAATMEEAAALRTWTILDLRSDRAAFDAAHLPGVLLAPMAEGRLSLVAGSYVDETASIALVVEREEALEEAVRALVRIGLDRVVAWVPWEELRGSTLLESIPRISPAELDPALPVLDVRNAAEREGGAVKGSVHVPLTRLALRLEEVPKEGPVQVHCAGGLRAALAGAFLASKGYEVIHVDGKYTEIPAPLRS